MDQRPAAPNYRFLAILLVLAAWALLLFRLDSVPPGLQHDEMFDAVDAIHVLEGQHALYFPANFGREPLFMYTAAGIFRLLGDHYVFELRFTGAIWALLGLLATVALARRYLPRAAALLAGALMAGCFWFLFAGRLGLEPIPLIALASTSLWLLDRALERGSWRLALAAGLVAGAAVYTYLAGRVLLGLLPLLLAWTALLAILNLRQRENSNSAARSGTSLRLLAVAFTAQVVVAAPILIYATTHAAAADRRIGEVGGALMAALRGQPAGLLQNVRETVLAVLWAAPPVLPYHYNVPGRPVLQPIWAACFLVGLTLTLVRFVRAPRETAARRELMLLAALVLGLAPDLLTGADALYMRGIVALPILWIITARGLWAVLCRIGIGQLASVNVSDLAHATGQPVPPSRFGKGVRGLGPVGWIKETAQRSSTGSGLVGLRPVYAKTAAAILVIALLGWHVAESSHAYFVSWAQAEPTQRIYNADFRAAVRFADAQPSHRRVYFGTDRLMDLDGETYQLYGPQRKDVRWFQVPQAVPLPATGEVVYVLPGSVRDLPPDLKTISAALIDPRELTAQDRSYTHFRSFRLTAGDMAAALKDAGVMALERPLSYGPALRLEAAGATDRGRHAHILTLWRALGPWPRPQQPPKLGVSVFDRDGYRWAQHDGPTSLPYETWQAGDLFLQTTDVDLPGDMAPGDYQMRLVMYTDKDGRVDVSREGAHVASGGPVASLRLVDGQPRGAAPNPPLAIEHTNESGALHLVGRWEPLDHLVVGARQTVHLSWRATAAVDPRTLRFSERGRAPGGQVLWQEDRIDTDGLPPSWPAGRTYRLSHRLHPRTAAAGSTQAEVELCVREGEAEPSCALIARSTVDNFPPVTRLDPPPQHPTRAGWRGGLALAGYDLARNGQTIVLTLYWRVDRAPDTELKRFVHALAADGSIVSQSDAVPDNHAIPMPLWQPDGYVIDRVSLEVPAGQAAAALNLGLYDPETGARIPVTLDGAEGSQQDHVSIALDR